jgi:aryl-alcohol dehydrogenase-like predicted oxidoreductase
LIERALALGLTHFDTAAFYGDGVSEAALGMVLGTRRHDVTITTKFGLLPTPMVGRLGPLAPVARKARGVLRRLRLIDYPRHLYTPQVLQRSFAASLRALATDHVDVLALHEPAGLRGITDDTIEALVALRRSGAARFIGVAGDDIAAIVERWGDVLDIVQTAEDRWDEAARAPDFTYSLFSRGVDGPSQALDQAEVDRRLAGALARRPVGAVIVQTRDPARLQRYVAVAAEETARHTG